MSGTTRPHRDFPVGASVVVSGRLTEYGGRLRITHPDHVVPLAERERIPALEPTWPLTAGIGQATIRRAMAAYLPWRRLTSTPR